MRGCLHPSKTPWRLPYPAMMRNGWRMETRLCTVCGKRFTRRYDAQAAYEARAAAAEGDGA